MANQSFGCPGSFLFCPLSCTWRFLEESFLLKQSFGISCRKRINHFIRFCLLWVVSWAAIPFPATRVSKPILASYCILESSYFPRDHRSCVLTKIMHLNETGQVKTTGMVKTMAHLGKHVLS